MESPSTTSRLSPPRSFPFSPTAAPSPPSPACMRAHAHAPTRAHARTHSHQTPHRNITMNSSHVIPRICMLPSPPLKYGTLRPPSGCERQWLTGSCRDPVGILSGSCRDPVGILSGSCRNPVGILSGSCWYLVGILLGSCRDPDPVGILSGLGEERGG